MDERPPPETGRWVLRGGRTHRNPAAQEYGSGRRRVKPGPGRLPRVTAPRADGPARYGSRDGPAVQRFAFFFLSRDTRRCRRAVADGRFSQSGMVATTSRPLPFTRTAALNG